MVPQYCLGFNVITNSSGQSVVFREAVWLSSPAQVMKQIEQGLLIEFYYGRESELS